MQWDIGWLQTPSPAPSSMKQLPSLAVYNPHCIPDEIHHQYIAAGVEGTEKQQKRPHNFIMQECMHFGPKCRDKQIFIKGQNRIFLSLSLHK